MRATGWLEGLSEGSDDGEGDIVGRLIGTDIVGTGSGLLATSMYETIAFSTDASNSISRLPVLDASVAKISV